jgi:hypothetical protein
MQPLSQHLGTGFTLPIGRSPSEHPPDAPRMMPPAPLPLLDPCSCIVKQRCRFYKATDKDEEICRVSVHELGTNLSFKRMTRM